MESASKIEAAGKSLACTMAYDNLVVDFGPPTQSAVNKSNQTLFHFTTGAYINHQYNVEDLRCADEIRKSDPNNDQDRHSKDSDFDYIRLMKLHPSHVDEHGLTTHERFFAWTL